MKKTFAIIGAGKGGLSAGCYARLNGYDTRIFEMHYVLDGACTSWRRGSTRMQKVTVPKSSRFTINVKDFLGSADDTAHDFSAKVATNDSVEIVAERSMYFNYQNAWNGGHATLGFSY